MAEGGDPGQAGERLADQIMAKVPPEFQSATDRIVTAGKKIMFSKNTHEKIMAKFDKLDLKQQPGTSIATGVAALMSLIEGAAKGPLQPPAIIAASAVLLSEAINFLAEAGDIQETPELVSEAHTELLGLMAQKLGLNPDSMPGVPEPTMQGGVSPMQGADPGMPPQRGVMQ